MSFMNTNTLRGVDAAKLRKHNIFQTPQMFCDIYCLLPGQGQSPHAHAGATKFYFVIAGHGEFVVGDRRETLAAGGIAWSMPGENHGVTNTSSEPLVLLVAMSPNPSTSSDVRVPVGQVSH